MQGEGGVRPLTPAFAAAINEACAKTGALLHRRRSAERPRPHGPSVLLPGARAEAASRLGRQGARRRRADRRGARQRGGGRTRSSFGDHGSTYGGNLLACRAALCVLDELIDGGAARARRARRARTSSSGCARWPRSTAIVKEVRGAGLMWGLELDARRGAGRAGRPRARRHRQPDGGHRRPAAAAARHHRSRGRRGARPPGCGARRRGSCRMTPRRGRLTLRTAEPSRRHEHSRAHRRRISRKGTCCRGRSASSTVHANRFVVATRGQKIVGCAELAPLSPHGGRGAVARRRSARERGSGVGDDDRRRAAAARPARRLRDAVRVHARARATSSTWASRSCRTSGCRRRSTPTA